MQLFCTSKLCSIFFHPVNRRSPRGIVFGRQQLQLQQQLSYCAYIWQEKTVFTLCSCIYCRHMLQSVRAYCETRGLPSDLQQRLLSYFEFQQQKAMDSDGSRILRALPDSLRMKVASHQYSYVIQRNSSLFKGCNLQFLNQLMLKLREIYLMPGETLIRAGDMSRELAFVARVSQS